jgi:transposase
MEVRPMPKSHPPYAPEFRRQMVDLVRAGRTPEELSREFEPTAQAIWNWVRQADRDEGRSQTGLSSVEREELSRLRRENRQLRQERDILAKAAAGSASLTVPPEDRLRRWFARKTDVTASGSSSS